MLLRYEVEGKLVIVKEDVALGIVEDVDQVVTNVVTMVKWEI